MLKRFLDFIKLVSFTTLTLAILVMCILLCFITIFIPNVRKILGRGTILGDMIELLDKILYKL